MKAPVVPDRIDTVDGVYRVRVVPNWSEALDGGRLVGKCNTMTREIFLDESISPYKTLDVLLHEIGHIFLDKRRGDNGPMQDEAITDHYAMCLTNLLTRNRALVKYISDVARFEAQNRPE